MSSSNPNGPDTPLPQGRITSIPIFRIDNPEVSSALDARIDDKGSLVLDGFDAGPRLRAFMGEDEYEYWLTIPADFKDTVLLHLVKERFQSVHMMKAWLEERGIPAVHDCY